MRHLRTEIAVVNYKQSRMMMLNIQKLREQHDSAGIYDVIAAFCLDNLDKHNFVYANASQLMLNRVKKTNLSEQNKSDI